MAFNITKIITSETDKIKVELDDKRITDVVTRQEEVESSVNELLDNQVIQGVIATDIENKLNAKEAEYAPELLNLKKGAKLEGWELQSKIRKVTPLVTFVDDDGHKDVLAKLKPLSETYNIPFTLAIVSKNAITPGSNDLSQADLLLLQDMGWEIASHTKNHTYLEGLSREVQEMEIKESKEDLESLGLKVNNFIYPGGRRDNITIELARKYYRSGRRTGGKGVVNLTPLETFDMPVTPLGSWFDDDVNPPFLTNTLEYYKYIVDKAFENNGWVIFMTHCYDPQHTSEQHSFLEQTIQYVQSKNIDIVTIDEGLNRRGNIIDIGRYYIPEPTKTYFVVGADGSYSGYDLQNVISKTNTGEYNNSSKPIDFKVGKDYITRINVANAVGFPLNQPGTLYTFTSGGATIYEGYLYQEYRPLGNIDLYRRVELTSETWSVWENVNSIERVIASDAVNLNTAGTDDLFINRYRTKCRIMSDVNKPENIDGVLSTDRTTGHNGNIFQTYEVSGSTNIYRRTWNSGNNTWNNWEQANGKVQLLSNNAVDLLTAGNNSLFIPGAISKCRISTADNMPDSTPGLLTTDRVLKSNDFIYQTFEVSNSINTYKRRWNNTTTSWDEWTRVTPIARTTSQRNLATFIKTLGCSVFDTTLGKPIWWDGTNWVDATGTAV